MIFELTVGLMQLKAAPAGTWDLKTLLFRTTRHEKSVIEFDCCPAWLVQFYTRAVALCFRA